MQPYAAEGSPSTVLVANRGEIVCRIIQTLRDNGIHSVAVCSDADTNAPHVRMVDVATRIGPSPARESHLVIDKIIDATHRCDTGGIYPGHGFLSENADFVTACEEAGAGFIGPPASVIDTMGNKVPVRTAVEARDVPTVPELSHPGFSDEDLTEAASSIDFPVLIKPSAGGGGESMCRVGNVADLPAALATVRREAAGAFGDNSPSIGHFVDTLRHIKVQILTNKHDNVIHLDERECLLQRCYQKVIKKAPSPLLGEETRSTTGEVACDAACLVGYIGAGTMEFIIPVKDPLSFFPVEMNTRLQVEHPVTEQVIGLDLAALQADIAPGCPLPVTQKDVTLTGHLIEVRVYAEDPAVGFLPTGGTIICVAEPGGAGIRVDSGITDDSKVSSLYGPMLAEITPHGEGRGQAFERLDEALGDTAIADVRVNIDFCRYLPNVPEARAGDLDTGLLDRVAEGFATSGIPDGVYLAATMDWLTSRLEETADSPWLTPNGWRASTPAAQHIRFGTGEGSRPISAVGTPSNVDVVAGDVVAGLSTEAESEETGVPKPRNYKVSVCYDGEYLCIVRDGVVQHFLVETTDHAGAVNHEEYVVAGAHDTWMLPRTEVVTTGAEADTGGSGVIQVPMPGVIIALPVKEGARVEVGDALLVMEVMKMKHTFTVEIAGEVSFTAAPGDQATGDQQLAVVTAVED